MSQFLFVAERPQNNRMLLVETRMCMHANSIIETFSGREHLRKIQNVQ